VRRDRRVSAVFCVVLLTSAALAAGSAGSEHAVRLSRHGLSVRLPHGWHGRIYRRPGGLPILQAGNFSLPGGDDDAGTKAMRRMNNGSVLIVLLESDNPRAFHYKQLRQAPQVTRRDLLPSFEGVPPSHAFARVTFRWHGGYFQLWLQFAVRPAATRLLHEANGVLATLTVAAAQPTALPYPLLVRSDGLRVYGPPRRPACPHALPLPAHALRSVERAVTLAMPPFEARLKLNGRDPHVQVGVATRSGYSSAAGGCGKSVWRRSIVATVRLPHIHGASLSQHTFAVVRIQQGWVLWAWIH
jgi:hypothetical protein